MADQKLRVVYLATHCIDNKVESFYTYSLAETIKRCLFNNIEIKPLLINDTSSAVAAKNEILSLVADEEYESIVFAGNDMSWNPVALLQIINSKHDAIALPCAKKSGTVVRFDLEIENPSLIRDENGFIKINYASFSMFKISNKLVTDLLDTNLSITNPSGREVKNVFDIDTSRGKYIDEDRVVCDKIKNLGYSIWVNPVETCANIAGNVFTADLASNLIPQSPQIEDIKSLYQ